MSAEYLNPNLVPGTEELKPYQENGLQIVEEARHDGANGGYLNWATGLGKTLVAAHSVKNFLEENPDGKALVLAHRGYILEHLSEEFGGVVGSHNRGHMFGQEFEDQGRIVFASFQAMNRRLGGGQVFEAFSRKEFGYVVVDEFHHGPAPTYRTVIDYFQSPFKLGLTATPERRDKQDISKLFGSELDSILLEEAIAKGWLARPEYHVLTDQVRKLGANDLEGKTLSEINKLLFVPKRDEEIAATVSDHWEKLRVETGREPRMLVFCPSIPHTEYFASLLPGNPKTLHSKQHPEEQQKNWEDFRNGKLNGLLAVDMLNEGVDVSDVNFVVFLRATESRAIYLQQVGRGLRLHPGKNKVVFLDFVASWERLNTLKTLEEGIKAHTYPHGKSDGSRLPQSVYTEATFNYSEEALQAVETIKFARGSKKRPLRTKETPRLDEWAQEESEVKDILHLSDLPKQRISQQEWQEYGERITEGDEDAKLEIFHRYLRTAYSTASTFVKTHPSLELTIDDCFQAAMVAVLSAVDKFDLNRDKNLRQEISLSVFSAISKANENRGLIKLPAAYYRYVAKFEKGREELVKKVGENVVSGMSFNEIATEFGLDPEEASLNRFLSDLEYDNMTTLEGVDNMLIDQPIDFENAVEAINEQILHAAMENLSYRERRVLEMRFGLGGEDPKTLKEVGDIFNVTRERVRQIEIKSMHKLQNLEETQALRDSADTRHSWFPYNPERAEKTRLRKVFLDAAQQKVVLSNKAYEKIVQEDPLLAGIAYHLGRLIGNTYPEKNMMRTERFARIDKNRLFESLGAKLGTRALSYTDFIRALRAMDRHGLVSCQSNERGSVIEAVYVSSDQLNKLI